MQLVRVGETKGLNLEMLVKWEVEAPPEPEPAPEPGPEMPVGVAETPPTAPAEPSAEAAAEPVLSTETVAQQDAPPLPEAAAPVPPPAPPPLRMILTLASGGAMETLTLEGAEAEAMRAYLAGKSGALIRAR